MISLAIVEDQQHIRSFLSKLIEESYPWIVLLGVADSVKTGFQLLQQHKPDVLLLDVEMPDGLGFDLLDLLEGQSIEVIFITAHNKYAIKAIRANALDYIEKPVDPTELTKALVKAKKKITAARNRVPALPKTQRIAIPSRSEINYLEVSKIEYIKADGSYVEFHLFEEEKPIVVARLLKEVEEVVRPLGFVRPHRSYLVNPQAVVGVGKTDGGYLMLKSEKKVPFSNQYKIETLSALQANVKSL